MRTILALLALCLVTTVHAQQLGEYQFASFDNRGFDSINEGNLNLRFSLPIVSRPGRGIGFNYALQYTGLIWSPVTIGGVTSWSPDPAWGFSGTLNGLSFSGYMTHQTSITYCPLPHSQTAVFSSQGNYVYHDALGGSHAFDYYQTVTCPNPSTGAGPAGVTPGGSGNATDGSGYSIPNNSNGPSTVTSKNGTVIVPAQSATGADITSITDSNGNRLSNNGSGVFTDTLGVQALKIAGSSTVTFTYPVSRQSDPNVTSQATTLYYRSYTVRSNFGCSGITEYGTHTVNLVDRVQLADGSQYSFTYEGTPSASDGAVTGRLKSIALPTGGQIQYAYNGGCGAGAGTGIYPDGSIASLTRTTSDGTKSFVRSQVSGNAATMTLVQDEKGNQTLLHFVSTNGFFYETHRAAYQGSSSGPLLQDVYTCYNNATAPCDTTPISLPITGTTILNSFNGGTQSQEVNTYDSIGNLLTTQLFLGPTMFFKTTNSYNALSSVTSSRTIDAGSYSVQWIQNGYDETTLTTTSGIPQHTAAAGPRGNLTSSHIYYDSSHTLDTSNAYYDTGVQVSSTAPGGFTTSYEYDSTQGFVISSTLPTPSSGVGLTTSAGYDVNSTVPLVQTGVNPSEQTTYNRYDGLLRPTSISLPSGSVVTATYTPNQTTISATQSATTSVSEVSVRDSYGRSIQSAIYNGQSQNPYYTTDTCYDSAGLVQFVSVPHPVSTVPSSVTCSGNGVSYQYDALGRVVRVSSNDGDANTTYYGRAVQTTDVNGVSRISQYDVLGRLTGVCEISAATVGGVAPQPCGMDIAGTGFTTAYQYDLAAHKVTVLQGGQQRTFQTDWAGRTVYTSEPERGDTSYTYSYNSIGLQQVRVRSRANQPDRSVKTATTTQYDSQGRIVSVGYDDPQTSAKRFYYDTVPGGLGWATSATNLKGHLAIATSGTGGSATGNEFSYDPAGNVISSWMCMPLTCGTASQTSRSIGYGWDLVGFLISESDPVAGSITYSRSQAGEITSISQNTPSYQINGAALVTGVINSAFGPTAYSLANGLGVAKSYDALGRLAGTWLCSGASGPGPLCNNGTSQVYGSARSIKGQQITSICDTLLNQCQNQVYDDFNRLTAVNDQSHYAGGPGSYTYTYDLYGNRLSQTSLSGGPSPNGSYPAMNQLQSAGYDAAGNETGDGTSHSYTYDAEGNLLKVDGGATATYVYDALNRRASTQAASVPTEHMFDALGRRTSSWNATGAGISGRIYMDSTQLAFRALNGQTFFDHQDPLGTERMRSNNLGSVASTEKSLAFGDNFSQNATAAYSDQDNAQFAELEKDSESGTEHAVERQYAAAQGRWMSPDPFDGSYDRSNPQSLNRYTYVLNNPLAYIDPDGTSNDTIYRDPETGLYWSQGADGAITIYTNGALYRGEATTVNGGYHPVPIGTFGFFSNAYAPTRGPVGSKAGTPGSSACTPVFCPANDTPPAKQPDPREVSCRASAANAEAQFKKDPKTIAVGGAMNKILSTLQGPSLPGGSSLSFAKWIGAAEGFFLSWKTGDALNTAFYDSVYRDCMRH